jgi:hypothetical protein
MWKIIWEGFKKTIGCTDSAAVSCPAIKPKQNAFDEHGLVRFINRDKTEEDVHVCVRQLLDMQDTQKWETYGIPKFSVNVNLVNYVHKHFYEFRQLSGNDDYAIPNYTTIAPIPATEDPTLSTYITLVEKAFESITIHGKYNESETTTFIKNMLKKIISIPLSTVWAYDHRPTDTDTDAVTNATFGVIRDDLILLYTRDDAYFKIHKRSLLFLHTNTNGITFSIRFNSTIFLGVTSTQHVIDKYRNLRNIEKSSQNNCDDYSDDDDDDDYDYPYSGDFDGNGENYYHTPQTIRKYVFDSKNIYNVVIFYLLTCVFVSNEKMLKYIRGLRCHFKNFNRGTLEPHITHVYHGRGTKLHDGNEGIINTLSFMSTSLNIETALTFTGSLRYIYVIEMQEEHHPYCFMFNESETEILLPIGTQLQVVGQEYMHFENSVDAQSIFKDTKCIFFYCKLKQYDDKMSSLFANDANDKMMLNDTFNRLHISWPCDMRINNTLDDSKASGTLIGINNVVASIFCKFYNVNLLNTVYLLKKKVLEKEASYAFETTTTTVTTNVTEANNTDEEYINAIKQILGYTSTSPKIWGVMAFTQYKTASASFMTGTLKLCKPLTPAAFVKFPIAFMNDETKSKVAELREIVSDFGPAYANFVDVLVRTVGERHETFTKFHQNQRAFSRAARKLPPINITKLEVPSIKIPTKQQGGAPPHALAPAPAPACADEIDNARASIADDVVDNSGLSRLLAFHAKFAVQNMNPQVNGNVAKGGKATTQKTYIYYKGYNYRKFRINRKVYIRTKYEGTVYLATIQAWQREEKRKKHTS